MDRWKTLSIQCKGGLNTSTDTLSYQPGEATVLTNFEPGIYGGYRRINGYSLYDTHQLSPATAVLGLCVFNGINTGGVVACCGSHVYYSSGSGWTQIDTSARTGAGKYTFAKYYYQNGRQIVMCDGVNPAAVWDGTTYTLINGTGTPATPKFATFWNGVLVLDGGNTNPQSVYLSAPNQPVTDFSGTDGAIVFNCHDNVVGLKAFRGNLYIFCQRSIYELSGTTSANYVLSSVATGIGCLAYNSIQECNGDLVYLSADGIRTLSGTMKLNDTELGDLSKPIINLANSVWPTVEENPDQVCSCIVRAKNQYRLFYAPVGATSGNGAAILGAIRPGKQTMTQFGTYISVWEWATLQGILATAADSDYINGFETIVHGDSSGYVYIQESGDSFNGANIPASYTSAPIQLDDPEIRKLMQKLTIYSHIEGNVNLTVQPIYDFGDTSVTFQPPSVNVQQENNLAIYGSFLYGTGTYGGGVQPEFRINIQGSGRIIQFSISSNDVNPPYSIQALSLQYRPLGRR